MIRFLSFNERTEQTSYEPVLQLIQNEGIYQLIKLTLENGEQLETTSGHPFYVQGKGWSVAANLKVGDVLRLHNGTTLVIKTLDTSTRSSSVFNFTVAHNTNYFIGNNGVLVHNANRGICMPSRKRAKEAAEHPHPGKKKPTPSKNDSKKREQYDEQQKYRYPERHPDSAYPDPHFHSREKSQEKARGKDNNHYYYPKRF